MAYLSSYLDQAVLDSNNLTVGKLADLVARLGSRFPVIVAVRIRTPDKRPVDVPWELVRSFDAPRVILDRPLELLERYTLGDRDVLLARHVLDKQIVDLDGRRLIRVQDIELFRVYDHLRLLAVDVSGSALLRRLGWVRWAGRVAARYPPRSVAWSDVDLGSWSESNVRLRVKRSGLHRLHPADLAEIASTLPATETKELFASLEHEIAADTLEEMSEDAQFRVLEAVGSDRGSELLSEMSPDDAADLLSRLSADTAEALLERMDPAKAEAARSLLRYEEGSAGGLMTTDLPTVGPEDTVAGVIEGLRRSLLEDEPLHHLYVVDASGLLLGEVTPLDLLRTERGDTAVRAIMRTDPVAVPAEASRDDVVAMVVKYNLVSLPVQDDGGHLLGVITVDDVLDLIAPRHTRRDRPRLFGG